MAEMLDLLSKKEPFKTTTLRLDFYAENEDGQAAEKLPKKRAEMVRLISFPSADFFFPFSLNVKIPFKAKAPLTRRIAQAPRWNDITIFHHLYFPPAMRQQMAGLPSPFNFVALSSFVVVFLAFFFSSDHGSPLLVDREDEEFQCKSPVGPPALIDAKYYFLRSSSFWREKERASAE